MPIAFEEASLAYAARRVKPIARTVIKAPKVPAAAAKKIATALRTLDEDASIERAEALLAAAAKVPYTPDGPRADAEWQALEALVNLDERAAIRVWTKLVASWTAVSPFGGTEWCVLARVHSRLKPPLPAKLRARARVAWAFGILSKVFQYSAGPSRPKPPKEAAPAWRQYCIEVTQHELDRARACLDAVRAVRGYEYTAKCMDIMLRREQGDAAGARASYDELVALARKKKRYAEWDVIAAMHVVLGVDDEKLAREIVASWQKRHKSERGELSLFES